MLFKAKYETLNFQSGAIAHEMRTPLANVVMNAKTLERMADEMVTMQNKEPARQARYLSEESTQLRQLAQRLERIAKGSQNFINLLLSNLRQDFDTVTLKTLTIQDCLNQVIEAFAFKPVERAKVHIDVQDNFCFEGNQDLMMHVFFNLLKNSLYFIQAAGKGEIYITARSEAAAHEIEFRDTGTGIEPQQLPHLFKAFYSQRPHGTGIGLSFCKKAMESMKGTIQVSSVLGKHTTFVLRLPRGKENFAKTLCL